MPIVLHGRPISKKNHQQIHRKGRNGTPFISQSEAYKSYEEACLWQLNSCKERYSGLVSVKCLYWMPDNRSRPDLVSLLQSTSDILEKAGIIKNDRDIQSYDGSRIMGVDRDKPRVEITIEEEQK